MHLSEESSHTELVNASAVAMLSTLAAAAHVRHSISERRAGRDPSAQEELVVAQQHVRDVVPELRELLLRMRLKAALSDVTHNDAARYVHQFDCLLIANRIGTMLHVIHQRLLSIYPSISEDLVEEARSLTKSFSALFDDDLDRGIVLPEHLVERSLDFVYLMLREV